MNLCRLFRFLFVYIRIRNLSVSSLQTYNEIESVFLTNLKYQEAVSTHVPWNRLYLYPVHSECYILILGCLLMKRDLKVGCAGLQLHYNVENVSVQDSHKSQQQQQYIESQESKNNNNK